MSQDHKVHDLTAEEVAAGIAEGRYLLVDVREPNEVAVEAYPDAVVVPLSAFDTADIPDPQGKTVVFACRSGKRSVTASLAAQADGWFIGELCYVVRSSGVPFLDMTPRGRVHAGLVRASRFLRNQRR